MNFGEILSAITAASEATKAAIAALQAHAAKLEAAYDAVAAHQQQIDAQGPATPPGPKGN